jgi:DNA-directed RNA polymerase specialized sigma24 family protein
MKMPTATQIANDKEMQYANSTDFCEIFNQDMNSLYLLSLLLTGDHAKAEQCFVEGLENAVGRNRVFKEWARSWTRRVIVQNALLMMNPRPGEGNNSKPASLDTRSALSAERPEIAAVLQLQPFDRFVFVMSVFEGYSEHDCSILLGCARRDVLAARARALRQLGEAAESYRIHELCTGTEEPILHTDSLLAYAS